MEKNIIRKHYQNFYGQNKSQKNKSIKNLLNEIVVTNAEGNEIINTNNGNKILMKNLIKESEKNNTKNSTLFERIRNNEEEMLPKITTPSTIGLGGLVLTTLFIIIIVTLIYFKDRIYNYFMNIYDIFQKGNTIPTLEEKYNQIIQSLTDHNNTLNTNNTKLSEENKSLSDKNNSLEQVKQQKEEEIKRKEIELEHLNSSIRAKEENNKKIESKIQNGGIQKLNNKIEDLSKFRKDQIVNTNGFCYIGYDLGRRECTDVNQGDICMSGQIFPTLVQCQNPELRTDQFPESREPVY
jgi:DNA repair exonuclease SbcCD ATPase subunit